MSLKRCKHGNREGGCQICRVEREYGTSGDYEDAAGECPRCGEEVADVPRHLPQCPAISDADQSTLGGTFGGVRR